MCSVIRLFLLFLLGLSACAYKPVDWSASSAGLDYAGSYVCKAHPSMCGLPVAGLKLGGVRGNH